MSPGRSKPFQNEGGRGRLKNKGLHRLLYNVSFHWGAQGELDFLTGDSSCTSTPSGYAPVVLPYLQFKQSQLPSKVALEEVRES